ncbi:MAG: YkgJ family cysteine cluster protein [Calditrichaeota bacterium]|nr:YkgJ family cysteine cluster protein [Calditrichota bacterium]
MDSLANLKQTILKDYPRLSEQDGFAFECGAHLECFNVCCADVNIFLTPYDVLRMRKAVGLGSGEFLARYTLVPFDKSQHLPTPLLKMSETEGKACYFVDAFKGCTIYSHRPWPCRMYPLGSASPGETEKDADRLFYFMMREEFCQGHGCPHIWTVAEWLEDQGVAKYAEFGEMFKGITLHPAFSKGYQLSPQQIEMYWIALFDLDKFRGFIFSSSFLKRFEIPADFIELLRIDDEALLKFGFSWTALALFGDKTLNVRPEAVKMQPQFNNKKSSRV